MGGVKRSIGEIVDTDEPSIPRKKKYAKEAWPGDAKLCQVKKKIIELIDHYVYHYFHFCEIYFFREKAGAGARTVLRREAKFNFALRCQICKTVLK